jgi:hypothetical protein
VTPRHLPLGPLVLLLGYVVPVLVTVVVLARAGAPVLAAGLAVVELAVSGAVHWAVRTSWPADDDAPVLRRGPAV